MLSDAKMKHVLSGKHVLGESGSVHLMMDIWIKLAGLLVKSDEDQSVLSLF